MVYHLLGDVLLLARGLLFPLLAPGLQPGDQTQHCASKDRGDTRQVEGYIVATKSIPQEACKDPNKTDRSPALLSLPSKPAETVNYNLA